MMTPNSWGGFITRWFPWLRFNANGSAIVSPKFIGSRQDLERYLGPMLQDLTRQKLWKESRRCQRCGSGDIDPARIKTADMASVIDSALEHFLTGRNYNIDLASLELRILEEFQMQEKATPILCKACLRRRQEVLLRESYKFPDLSVYKSPELKLGPRLGSSAPLEMRHSPGEGIEKVHYSAAEFKSFRTMKIGKLVCRTLPRMIKNNGLSERVISKLQTREFCKLIFDVNYPVLLKLPRHATRDIGKDENGHPRYYSMPVKWKGSEYLITSQWFEGSHELYLKWLQRKVVVED